MFIFINYLGNSGSPNVNDFVTKHQTKTIVIRLGASNLDSIQKFGTANREFTFKGFVNSLDDMVFLETLVGDTGSIAFYSPISGSFIPADFDPNDFDSNDFNTVSFEAPYVTLSNVYYMSIEWEDSGTRPSERNYVLQAVEVK